MPLRTKIINEAVEAINAIHLPHPIRVGIDGVSASGKTQFADSLVEPLEKLGRHVIRASIDGFHHPQEHRYRQGEGSVDGYVEDSFNKPAVIENVLLPLGPGGNLEYQESLFDFVSNEETQHGLKQAKPDSILIFEGVMLFCDQLSEYFDFRILIDAQFDTIVERAMGRDLDRLGGRENLLSKYYDRYIPGQKRYIDQHQPNNAAHFVVNNDDYRRPVVSKRLHPIFQPPEYGRGKA